MTRQTSCPARLPTNGQGIPEVGISDPGFRESHQPRSREELFKRRIGDLRLALHGTRLERLVERLYADLDRAGLCFRPPVYLSDDWGCPDRVPIVGMPFYLADAQLTRLEDELRDGVEAESDNQIMRYLRHEAGHAINYAYRLYDSQQWTDLFGPFARPYPEVYTPNPFSRSFVRHLPGWYAQKHPDEDFAETFAVWLDPASHWREVYAGWNCLKKLSYVDELMLRIGPQPPPITADNYDTQEDYLACTIGEHYRNQAPPRVDIPQMFDSALRDIFPAATDLLFTRPAAETASEPAPEEDARKTSAAAPDGAANLIRRHRRVILSAVYYWTGLNDALVRGLVDHLEERSSALKLAVGPDPQARLVELVTFVTALCMNHLHTGDFVQK